MSKVVFYPETGMKLETVFDEIALQADDGRTIYFKPHQKENGEWTLIGSETSSVNED